MQKSAQHHIGRANSNSNTSKPLQSVSSVGNLRAEKADFEMRAAYMLAAEAWACIIYLTSQWVVSTAHKVVN